MIGRLTGIIDSHIHNPLIIDVHGVGYVVRVPEKFLARIKPGKPHTLLIHSHIREDTFDLYGFPTQQELVLFELLLTVSGIGPKTAILVVDRGVDAVETAVQKGDVEFFTTIPRLGTKNAQKIIIECKGKLDLTQDSGETKQVADALSGMGFDKQEIREALRKLDPKDITVEQKIRHALKLLSK